MLRPREIGLHFICIDIVLRPNGNNIFEGVYVGVSQWLKFVFVPPIKK